MLLINMYIIARKFDSSLTQRDFRWALIGQLLNKADELDARRTGEANEPTTTPAGQQHVPMVEPEESLSWTERWHPDSSKRHHLDRCPNYVTPDEAKEWEARMKANPCRRVSKKKPRYRDNERTNDLVLNPAFTSGADCVVCKYHPDPSKRRSRRTNSYCRECSHDSNFPFTLRCSGYKLDMHPRLCSQECFELFHSTRISLLDIPRARKRKRR